jgi:hypothetical protein
MSLSTNALINIAIGSVSVREAPLSSAVQPNLEGYDTEQRASETTPSTDNSLGTCAYVPSSEYSNENFDEVWHSVVYGG